MKNIRKKEREPRPEHPDFQWLKSESHEHGSNKAKTRYLDNLRELEPDFGILKWGHSLGKRYEVSEETHAHIYWIKDVSEHGKVSEILESIKYKRGDLPHPWMGEVNFAMEDLIVVYERKKREYFNE